MERDREIMDEGGEIDRPTSSLEREDAAAQTVDSNRGDEWTGAWLENVSGSDVVGVPGVPACVPLRLSAPPASPTILIGRQRSLVDMCASPPPPIRHLFSPSGTSHAKQLATNGFTTHMTDGLTRRDTRGWCRGSTPGSPTAPRPTCGCWRTSSRSMASSSTERK
jgi:hypothetical protein